MFVKVLCFVFIVQRVLSQEKLLIGGIFYEDEAVDLEGAMNVAAEDYDFTTSVKTVSRRGQTLEINKNLCELAEEKVIGVIDGTSDRDSEHIQALCDAMELPHVMVQPTDINTENWSALNMFPSPDAYNLVLTEIIIAKEWTNFTIIYVKGHSINRVNKLLAIGNTTNVYTVTVREVAGDDYREVLIEAKKNGYFNFVVDCPSRDLEKFLIQAQQVGLMADEHSYIFVSPDIFTLDLSRYRYGGVNMTGLRLVELDNEKAEAMWKFTDKFNNMTGVNIGAEDIKTKVVLVYDTVKVFYEAVTKMNMTVDAMMELSCDDVKPWLYGSTLLNFMKTNKIEGLTKALVFDGLGQRTNVYFRMLELTPAGNQTIFVWENEMLINTRPIVPEAEIAPESIMRNKTFKILISDTPPYGYVVLSSKQLEGNARYEGFTVDLIEKLSEILGFNYEFEIEKDYGKIDKITGEWTGMVRKLREDRADFALCDLTITSSRQSAIDFSTPFITTGIGILYKEPSKQPPEMFSFMKVFSKEVWYYMLFVQMGVGVIMIFVGRISHKEWQNPVPCIESPEELSNQFSFANSLWLIIGSVMQQGSEIAPIALAPRMITSVWWFFTMVMVASYVGTLVAVLTVEKNDYPFENVEGLYKQNSIKYGAKSSGSTIDFFSNSTNQMYREMYSKMVLVDGNDEGVQMAENSSYAFFMESASIEYYTERHCDLLIIGKLLDSKSYGIGMKKGSPYKKYIDNALLHLKESGELQMLKDLWWKEKRGGGKCGKKGDEEIKKLDMKNMLGAFVVLGVGCLIGIFISILDMLWGVFKRSVKYNTSFKYELVEELKFAIMFSGDIKPVKKPPKSEGSEEALAAEVEAALAEGKDELGSLRSARTLRSGRSTSTHKSSHSHSSRHSNNSLIIAFAKRRKYD